MAEESKGGYGFGTFGGVFTPSMLTIFGVIMFMRSGFVAGQAGLWMALTMVTLASGITFLTGLSISAISTNTQVKGGGAYFLISRSLGPEFGGAIGLALYIAQAISVPFYILGFAEALVRSFPVCAPYFQYITLGTGAAVLLLAFVGANWAIRVQYVIFAVLILAILSFMIGSLGHWDTTLLMENLEPAYTSGHDYWVVFAIFFPAVTGIMAGLNMSGDLKNPSKSLPKGTLIAIVVGYAVYMLQMVITAGTHTRIQMIERPFTTLLDYALFGIDLPVILGVFAATLSSAIGSIVGAPRILQALSRDDPFPFLKHFAKGSGDEDEPHRALWLTAFFMVGILLLTGDGGGGDALNVMAGIISMFFLYTYGMCNVAAFVESFGDNPSFRPRFRAFHWTTALAGAFTCVAAAFLIDAIAAVVALFLVAAIYLYVRRQILTTAFGDARRGFVYNRVRKNLLLLAEMKPHPKNWRPTILAFSGNPDSRSQIVHYGAWLEGRRGIFTLATILVGRLRDLREERQKALGELNALIEESQIYAFPEVVVAPDLHDGIQLVLQSHSIGPIKPNVMLLGWSRHEGYATTFARNLRTARTLGMSLLVLTKGQERVSTSDEVHIWWRGKENGHLMVILTHLLKTNDEWRRSRVHIIRQVNPVESHEAARDELEKLREAARVDFDTDVIVSAEPFADVIHKTSAKARLVLLGFQVPELDNAQAFHSSISKLVEPLPTTILVCSSGDADLFS